MAYEKTTWAPGDVITSQKLNHLEDGVSDASSTFTVTVTQSGSTYSADKTISEINEAYVAGSRIEFKLGDLILLPTSITSSIVMAGVTVTDDTVQTTSYALVMLGSTVSLITDGVFSTYINAELKTDPNNYCLYISFDSAAAASKAQGGALFDIFQGSHHMLCQFSEAENTTNRFYATITDATYRRIYACKLDFTTDTKAYIVDLLNNTEIQSLDDLDIISMNPHKLSGVDIPSYYGYSSANTLGFWGLSAIQLYPVTGATAAVVNQLISALLLQAESASDGIASGYIQNPMPDFADTVQIQCFEENRVPMLLVETDDGNYTVFIGRGGATIHPSIEHIAQAAFTSEIINTNSGGNAKHYIVDIAFNYDIVVIKVTYTSVPSIPMPD